VDAGITTAYKRLAEISNTWRLWISMKIQSRKTTH